MQTHVKCILLLHNATNVSADARNNQINDKMRQQMCANTRNMQTFTKVGDKVVRRRKEYAQLYDKLTQMRVKTHEIFII